MLLEFHCPCGHRTGLEIAKFKPTMRCGACKAESRFVPPGVEVEWARWMTVGGRDGAARLAVPLPINAPLRVGRAAALWLSLPGEEIGDEQAELKLKTDGRLEIQHLAGDCGTWIDRARIATGVVGEDNVLRIGPYVLRLVRHPALCAAALSAMEPEVIVEEEEEPPPKPPPKASRGKKPRAVEADEELAFADEEDDDEPITDDAEPAIDYGAWTRGQKIRVVVCAALIFVGGGTLSKWYFWPAVSEEMPTDTIFYCPVDGREVRGRWTSASGAPLCPQCGQRCLGELLYKPEITAPPASQPSGADEDGSDPTDGSGSDGVPLVR